MRTLISIILGVSISVLFVGNTLVFGQEETSEPETQWVMGEVVSVDSVAKTVAIKYLDYETYEDKEMIVSIGEGTTLENFNSLDELAQGNNVSIDYIVTEDGTNLAVTIGLEAQEGQAPEVPEVTETAEPSQE